MAETLKEKTAKGLFWGAMNNGAMQVIGLVFGIVLGRLLTPSDYGMIAMITVFSLIATALQNSGFITAITNLKKPTDNDYNSVFWFNITVGFSLYVILFFSAPLIAAYYHTPALTPLCRYAFLSILFASLSTAQSAYLFKNMIIYNIVNTALFWYYSPWRPNRHIDFAPVRKMFRFSCKLLATTITTHINNNVLNILLGHYFSAHETGNYNQAYQWDFKAFSVIQGMVDSVGQPVMVDLRDQPERQLKALRKLIRLTAFISFPLMLGFGMVSREFIIITITEKWLASADLLRILCISGAVLPICSLLSNLLVSKGKSGTYFLVTFSLGIVQIVAMLLIWQWGIHNMVKTYVVLNLIWLFIWQYFANKLIGYKVWMFLKDILPFALAALCVMTVTYVATMGIEQLILLLMARVAMAVVLYYLVMRIAGAAILKECMGFLKHKLGK